MWDSFAIALPWLSYSTFGSTESRGCRVARGPAGTSDQTTAGRHDAMNSGRLAPQGSLHPGDLIQQVGDELDAEDDSRGLEAAYNN